MAKHHPVKSLLNSIQKQHQIEDLNYPAEEDWGGLIEVASRSFPLRVLGGTEHPLG